MPAILLNWPQISNLKRQDWGRLSCIFIFISIYISWWYSAQRSLGFIAGSPVSYGPLPEYKASPGKNYNKISKTRHRKFLFENSYLLQICEHLVQFEVFPLEPRLHFAPISNSATAVGCQLQAQTPKYQQISLYKHQQISVFKYQQTYLFYLSHIWDKMNTSQSTQ